MSLKILHISGSKNCGGNEQQLLDLITELKETKNFIFGVDNTYLASQAKSLNIKFIPCKGNKLNKFLNYRYLKLLCTEIKPDIIHLHTGDSLTTFVLADLFFKLNIPCVYSKKGMFNSSSFLSRYKYNYKGIDAIICVSKRVKEDFKSILWKKNRAKAKIIYDGVSINRLGINEKDIFDILNINKKRNNLINIANHDPAKDLPTLIKTLNVIVNVYGIKDIHLIQIGKYSKKNTPVLLDLINQYNLSSYITLAGFIENASSYLSQFDMYVMSSQREGFPLVIYESFYNNVPVISTKAGGISEIIIDSKNGLLSEVYDYESLADNVRRLILDFQLRNNIKINAKDTFVKNFTADKCANSTLNLYKSIIK